jgi:predicted permease
MRKLRAFWVRLRTMIDSERAEQDVAAELESHVEMHVEDNLRSGMTREEARRQALIHLGGLEQTRQAMRERSTVVSVASVLQDARYALRQLRRSPGFAATAVLTLALGIGANVAVYSLFDAVILHPLPWRDPGRLMLVREIEPGQGQDELGVAIQEARDYESRSHSFSAMGTFESAGFNLTGSGRPLRVNAAMLSHSVFPLLGVAPVVGRTFTADEDRFGDDHVAVLSWSLWKNEYGGDTSIAGKTILLDEKPYTVIGVMPASFRFPFDGRPLSEMADLWVPDAIAPNRLDPNNRLMEFGVGLIGRLRPGVTPSAAGAEMRRIAREFEAEHPDVYSGTLHVEPHTRALTGWSMQKARPLVWLLAVAVLCVLLIACANVAGLLLARAGHREREMGIRAAVGAHRLHLLRQCLVESIVLALAGGLLGIAFAEGILLVFHRWGPESVPRLHDAALHPGALGFALLLTLGVGILFGLAPAWKSSRVTPLGALRDGSQLSPVRNSQRLQDAMAAGQIALAMVLLTATGLVLRSFVRVLETPPGFDPQGTAVVRTVFDRARYPVAAQRRGVQRELLERLSHLPGLAAVAAASHLPLGDERQIGVRMEHAAPDDFHWAANSLVTPGYFRAMGIALLRGRDFSDSDRPDSPPVAIVSEAFVRAYLPGENALGKRFHWGDRALFTIIGVAADVHVTSLDADAPPMVYNSMFQVESGATGSMALVLRGSSGVAPQMGEIRSIVWSLDRDLPLYRETSLETLVAESLAQRRFTVLLLAGFAVSALLLAAIGIFGVLSYRVEQRRREIGLRMALGADRRRILVMIVCRGLMTAGGGCVVGLLLSIATTRLIEASLYRVGRFDPLTLAMVCSVLLGVTLFAVWLPARRAASIDPMQALRLE